MSSVPKVSVVVISYNQEKYIKQALDSFVMQKTNFAFEVIVADDNSTDKTPKIIQAYAEKYPDFIKPILREKNIGVVSNFIDAMSAAQGKYLALCEGDDYWTDQKKLQRQVDFLDRHQDYALCFHPVKVFFESNEKKGFIFPKIPKGMNLTPKELIRWNFIQTNSVMYRRQNYEDVPTNILPLDWYLHLYHAQYGKIGFIPNIMAAYRRHPGGMWWDTHNKQNDFWKKYGLQYLGMFYAIQRLYKDKKQYDKVIMDQVRDMIERLIMVDKGKENKLLEQAATQFPALIADHLLYLNKANQEKDTSIYNLNSQVADLSRHLERKDMELQDIKNSRLWKLRSFIAEAASRKRSS